MPSSSRGGGGAMPPPKMPGGMRAKVITPAADEKAKARKEEAASGVGAYLTSLGTLARELDAQARGSADVVAIRLIRQRLVEWSEDLGSVGGSADLVAAIDALVKQLTAALASAALATELLAIAAALLRLANGEPPPAAPKPGRSAFWK